MTKEEFIKYSNELGIIITDEILNNLNIYKNLLIEWNKKFNLTNIIEEKDIYLKHFYDSLCLSKSYDLTQKINLLDFGSGAGFPGLVLAIVYNNLNVTLLEANGKKIVFLEAVKNELKLNNVTIINSRMEDYAQKNKEKFDIVTCRAVSNLGIILELSSSLVKINGLFLPLKSNIKEELVRYKKVIEEMSYTLTDTIVYNLPIEKSIRSIPIFKKIKPTNEKYPRNYNIILKNYK